MNISWSTSRLFLFAILSFSSLNVSFSQDVATNEPEFIGQAFLIKEGGENVVLEKEKVKMTNKAKLSLSSYITQKLVMDGCCSKVVGESSNNTLKLIVRVANNNIDPLDVVQIVQFEKSKKERFIETFSFGGAGANHGGNVKKISFKGKRFGASSFIIDVNLPGPGEFGLLLQEPSLAVSSIATFSLK